MSDFTLHDIERVWDKAKVQTNVDGNVWRKDFAGAWIKKTEYGNVNSDYGWEIDHAKPSAKHGSNHLNNLQPLQWQNNRTKGDDYPSFKTSISSHLDKNIEQEKSWSYNS